MSNFKNLDTVEKLMDGYNPYRQRQEETRGLIKKWEPTGLLEGISDDQKVSGMAVLLENQARQLIDESRHTGTSSNSEEETSIDWFDSLYTFKPYSKDSIFCLD